MADGISKTRREFKDFTKAAQDLLGQDLIDVGELYRNNSIGLKIDDMSAFIDEQ